MAWQDVLENILDGIVGGATAVGKAAVDNAGTLALGTAGIALAKEGY